MANAKGSDGGEKETSAAKAAPGAPGVFEIVLNRPCTVGDNVLEAGAVVGTLSIPTGVSPAWVGDAVHNGIVDLVQQDVKAQAS